MEQGSANQFSINFPRHCVLGYGLFDTSPLNEVDSWEEVVQPTNKPTSVDPRRLKLIKTLKKTTNNKKTHQRNKKSRRVIIQVSKDQRNKNKEPRRDSTSGRIKPRSESAPNNLISTVSELHEIRNNNEDPTPQRMTSVARHSKNRLYINSGAFLHILFNKELMGELHNTDKPLKIQAAGKPFHLKNWIPTSSTMTSTSSCNYILLQ